MDSSTISARVQRVAAFANDICVISKDVKSVFATIC